MTDEQVIGIMAAILIAPILAQAATGDKECLFAIKSNAAMKDCAREAKALFKEVQTQ